MYWGDTINNNNPIINNNNTNLTNEIPINNKIRQEYNKHTKITYWSNNIYPNLTDMRLLSRGLDFGATNLNINKFLSEMSE